MSCALEPSFVPDIARCSDAVWERVSAIRAGAPSFRDLVALVVMNGPKVDVGVAPRVVALGDLQGFRAARGMRRVLKELSRPTLREHGSDYVVTIVLVHGGESASLVVQRYDWQDHAGVA